MTAEIVGVVGNVLKDGNDRQPQPELYFVHGSHGQRIAGQVNLVIRTTGNPSALARGRARASCGRSNARRVVDRIEPLTAKRRGVARRAAFAAAVMAGFASVAMVLAGGRPVRRAVLQRVAARPRARDSRRARRTARRPRPPRAARRAVGDADGIVLGVLGARPAHASHAGAGSLPLSATGSLPSLMQANEVTFAVAVKADGGKVTATVSSAGQPTVNVADISRRQESGPQIFDRHPRHPVRRP